MVADSYGNHARVPVDDHIKHHYTEKAFRCYKGNIFYIFEVVTVSVHNFLAIELLLL